MTRVVKWRTGIDSRLLPRRIQNGSKKMKFYGNIGFMVTEDEGGGVWREKIREKTYSGDVLRLQKSKDSGEHIIDGLRLNSQFSILMDPWFQEHFGSIRYIVYMGTKWTAETVDPSNYPRVLITPGGIYHGDEPEEDQETGTSEETGGDSGE